MPSGPTDNQLSRIAALRLVPTPGLRADDRAALRPLLGAVRAGDQWAPGSRFVKRDADRWVWMGRLSVGTAEHELVIKGRGRRALDRLPDRHAIKQSVGARRLDAIGVATSAPIAALDIQTASVGRERWLVLRAVPGESLAHVLHNRADTPGLARRCGALVRTLSEAGLFNRDHKASNQIVTPGGEVGIIDTVAIRKKQGPEARRRMLLAMCKELRGIGAMPRRAQLWRCLRAASDEPSADWRAVSGMLARAGDTTPRVDPIGNG